MVKLQKLVPLLAFCLYFGKLFFQPPNHTDAAIIFILALISCYFEYKNETPKIVELQEQFSKLQKDFEDKNKEIENLKSAVSSMKLGNGMRPVNNARG